MPDNDERKDYTKPENRGELPRVGSFWKHRNGVTYAVTAITNLPNSERYKTTVVYMNPSGAMWSRPLEDWHRSMTLQP